MSDKETVSEKKKKEYGKFDRWEIEGAVDTIIKAEQIKLDKEKMKYVLPLLEKQKKALDNALLQPKFFMEIENQKKSSNKYTIHKEKIK